MGHRHICIVLLAIKLMGIPALLRAAGPATVPADEVATSISQIEAMKRPELDPAKLNDLAYRESYNEQVQKFSNDRAAKINALYARFPQDAKVRKLMLDRWVELARFGEKDIVIKETTPILAATPDSAERIDLLYVRAEAWVWTHMFPKEGAQAVEEFLKAAPDDVRGSELLFFLAGSETNPQKQAQIYRRAAADAYAASGYAAISKGKALQSDAIGKPLELSFNDLVAGKPISVQKDLKGRIVVIIFWATWCGPCKAELPEEKRLYTEYKDRGVEFIGVSLDEPEKDGGLKALKSYLAENPIPWPQYYQGNGVNSEFSSKYGVTAVPQIFVIDREGKLATMADGRLGTALREAVGAK